MKQCQVDDTGLSLFVYSVTMSDWNSSVSIISLSLHFVYSVTMSDWNKSISGVNVLLSDVYSVTMSDWNKITSTKELIYV